MHVRNIILVPSIFLLLTIITTYILNKYIKNNSTSVNRKIVFLLILLILIFILLFAFSSFSNLMITVIDFLF